MLAHCTKSSLPPADAYLPPVRFPNPRRCPATEVHFGFNSFSSRTLKLQVKALDRSSNNSSTGDSGGASKNVASSPSSSVPNANYVVPLDKSSSCITRPLAEILRDLNKRIPDNIIKADNNDDHSTFITWYHANRMLSFYAPDMWGSGFHFLNRILTSSYVSIWGT